VNKIAVSYRYTSNLKTVFMADQS